MSYGYISIDNTTRDAELDALEKAPKQKLPDEFGYEFVRFGESSSTALKHDKHTEDITVLLEYYDKFGYSDRLPRLSNYEFLRHVVKFRAMLDCWEQIPITKVFSKDEIYVRCLKEGPSYVEFIKKARSTTLRGLTSETYCEIEEEYFFPDNYKGYDSIIHERNLIHWDDREDVDDVKYAFMEPPPSRPEFQRVFEDFLETVKVGISDFDLDIDQLSELKNTKMYDPTTGKSSLMREFFCEDVDVTQPYMAKRCIVLTEPASTRDTGVGDPSTVAKVKLVNKLCRTILERCRHSASAPGPEAQGRLKRVLQRNCYLHLDFKKYGLAFVRELMNMALSIIGHKYAIDVSNLLITNFYIDIDGEVYETSRGSMLGWMDCLNELCVHAILQDLCSKGLEIDWVSFNDDVEISFWNPEDSYREKAEMVRDLVISEFDSYGILISISKTYASRASIFLEKYFRFDEKYSLDMEKRQLAVRPYARSLVTKYPWKAKIWFAAAHAVWHSEDIASRCILTSKIEFCEMERSAPLYVGGWYPSTTTLDESLLDQDQKLINLAVELNKLKMPDISSKPNVVGTSEKIYSAKVSKIGSSRFSSEGREKFDMKDTVFDVNFEASGALDLVDIRCREYTGRDERFVSTYRSIVSSLRRRLEKLGSKDNP